MGKITINELSDSLKDNINSKQNATDSSLETNNKTVVGAINELFSNVSNNKLGKQLIANAIGEPLNAEDTFQAMSNDINSLLSTFKTNMTNSGVAVESGDKFKQLINKVGNINTLQPAPSDTGRYYTIWSTTQEHSIKQSSYSTITTFTPSDYMPGNSIVYFSGCFRTTDTRYPLYVRVFDNTANTEVASTNGLSFTCKSFSFTSIAGHQYSLQFHVGNNVYAGILTGAFIGIAVK